ncbi:MAG: glycosyltransferase [Akkermansiaceae bacterium]|nr:glycosyltransferase [Armatimonadota bacterium]
MDPSADQPLISVLIPTRNRAVLVQETIRSVLTQQWGHFELVISNNNSSDNTQEVLEEIAAGDKRVRVVSPPELLPMTAHWNWAWSQLRGKYGALLSDDDLWEPTFLGTMAEAVREHPDLDVAATDFLFWKEGDERPLQHRDANLKQYAGVVPDPLQATLKHNLFFLNCSIMRRETFAELGGYGPTFVGDYELFVKAALAGKQFYYIPEAHLKYRVHATQATDSKLIRLTAEMLEGYIHRSDLPWGVRQRIRRTAGGTWALVGQYQRTERKPEEAAPMACFLRGVKVCPWHPANWVGIAQSVLPSRT